MKQGALAYASLTILAVSCGPAPRPRSAATDPQRAVDPAGLKIALGQKVQAQYAAIERGDLQGWAAPFSPDVFMFGSAHHEALVGKGAVIAAIGKTFHAAIKAGATFSVRSTRLTIGVSADGRRGG